MKNKGFTLVEIIAVIVLLGVVIVFATTNVMKFINSSKDSANNSSLKDVQDAALTYALTLYIPDDCAITQLLNDSNYASYSLKSGCERKTITVQDLISNQYFKDDANVLKRDGKIAIYKYKDNKNGKIELRTYAPKSIIK